MFLAFQKVMRLFQFSQTGSVRGSVRCGFGSVRLSSVRLFFGSKLKKSFFKCPRPSPVARDPPTVTHVPLGKYYLGKNDGGGRGEWVKGREWNAHEAIIIINKLVLLCTCARDAKGGSQTCGQAAVGGEGGAMGKGASGSGSAAAGAGAGADARQD